MSKSPSHHALVEAQFGARAQAYVASQVHATGEDLAEIAREVATRPGARVLDMGCGGGHVSFAMAPHADSVTAYDLSAEMLRAVQETAQTKGLGNIVTRQGKAEDLPFDAASFDVVASRFSAHHWHGFADALKEARRVLKPNGVALFADTVAPISTVADTWLQGLELIRDPSHVRDYTVAEWSAVLVDAGFAPAPPVVRRLRLDFTAWVTRMATPEIQVQALRALQVQMPEEVARHVALEPDGSYTIDVMLMRATPRGA